MIAAAATLLWAFPAVAAEPAVRVQVKEPYGLEFVATNATDQPEKLLQPVGKIWRAASGERLISLRPLEVTLPAHHSATISIPVAALSSQYRWKLGEKVQGADLEEKALEPLSKYLSTRDDIPRETSQLVVLALLEDMNYAGWQKYLAANRAPDAPAAPMQPELAGALDAVTILHAVVPGREFALASDPELKLRSLRDPALRPKALQLFGLTIPGDAPAGGVAPDLAQLLHTKPGDNCPICRLRQAQESRADLP